MDAATLLGETPAEGFASSWSPNARMQMNEFRNSRMDVASLSNYSCNSVKSDDNSSMDQLTARDEESPQILGDGFSKKSKAHRDPTSHRVIEKRRRDRMNNCLSNLSKLIPSNYLKKGRGRIEKTEIIEMAIRYMKHVELERRHQQKREHPQGNDFMLDKGVGTFDDNPMVLTSDQVVNSPDSTKPPNDRYQQGFFDCVAETFRFLVGVDVNGQVKTKLLLHLRSYFVELTSGTPTELLNCAEIKQTCTYSTSAVNHGPEELVEDEPLNMSMKRPRLNADPAFRLVQWTGEGASQLRGILESKDTNHSAVSSSSSVKHISSSEEPKTEPKQESCILVNTSVAAVPRSSSQALGAQIQHRFTSILEQPAAFVMPKSYNGAYSSNSSSSTQYPSSPSSSTSSYDSPPQGHSPHSSNAGVPVPVFALHPTGLFYVPMVVNSGYLEGNFQSLVSASFVDRPIEPVSVSHPVTINVNFSYANSGAMSSNYDQRLVETRSHTRTQPSVICPPPSLSRSSIL